MQIKHIFNILLITVFSVFQVKGQSYTRQSYFKSLFAGEYKTTIKVLASLKNSSSDIVKTKLLFADFYYIMYETSGDMEVYNILCKKEADFVNKTLSEKKTLSSNEVATLISAKAVILKIQFKKKKYLKVAKEFQSIIKHLRYAIEHETHPELKLISGMYNYYIETAKEDYPIAYPVLIFFPSGNKIKGIKLLKECSRSNSIFIKTRARLFLANIYRADEKDFAKAKYYFQLLLKNNPNNVHWRKEYIYTLRKYNKVEEARNQKYILLNTIKDNPHLTKEQINFLKNI